MRNAKSPAVVSVRHAEGQGVRAEQAGQLIEREEIIFSLLAVAVGVLPAAEAARGLAQFAQNIFRRPLGNAGIPCPFRLLISLGYGKRSYLLTM